MKAMRYLAVLAAVITMLVGVAGAIGGEKEDKQYQDMLLQALKDPMGMDYIAFRQAYAASSFYKKSESDPLNIVALGSDVTTDDLKRFVFRNFPIINTQILALDEKFAPKDSPKHTYHLAVGRAIADALLEAYDGKSAETAIPVLIVAEEYILAQFLRVTVSNQSLVRGDNGKSYDVLDGVDDSGKPAKIWFDISAFF